VRGASDRVGEFVLPNQDFWIECKTECGAGEMIDNHDPTPDFMSINNKLAVKVCDVFDWIFQRPNGLCLFKLWSNLTGFDIVKFDQAMNCLENESCSDAVLRQYGEMGKNLIMLLISRPDEMSAYLDSTEGKLSFDQQREKFENGSLLFGQGQPTFQNGER
jgi:hypothetical protein